MEVVADMVVAADTVEDMAVVEVMVVDMEVAAAVVEAVPFMSTK